MRWPQGLGAAPALRFVAVVLVPALCLALGHAPLRALQMIWLMAPVWLLWYWPLPRFLGVQRVVVGLWLIAFTVDAWVRAYMQRYYGAAPDSSLVLTAMANAHAQEAAEYMVSHARQAAPWVLAALASVSVLLAALWGPLSPVTKRASRTLWVVLLIVALLPYALKPSRRLHPVVFWDRWASAVSDQQESWRDLERQRETWHRNAAQQVRALHQDPSTVVVVLTDSVNRDNLQLYGYPRPTTPELSARQAQWGGQWATVKEAWSTQASTVPALQDMWLQGAGSEQHLLALARAAGYRVWWISNHDDLAIKNLHARLADEWILLNRMPGRSTRSMDSVVLPPLKAALSDPAPRKLVVVHLLGAHHHYHLRFPAGEDVFEGAEDAVSCHMRAQDRPVWLRAQRNDYDAALRHQEGVVADTLDLTATLASGPATWIYKSDHGQEVGHTMRHAGHSPRTASGYRIPLLLWRSPTQGPWPAELQERPFRADWWSPFMADVLALDWPGLVRHQSLLSPDYRWQAPALWDSWMATAASPISPACLKARSP